MRPILWLAILSVMGCFDYGAGAGLGGGGSATDAGAGPGAFTHVGVIAGSQDMMTVSGTVRLTRGPSVVTGQAQLTSGVTVQIFPDDAGTGPFPVVLSNGATGNIVFSTDDAGVEGFGGSFSNLDAGFRANVAGAQAQNVRLFCGTFSGAVQGSWNFAVVNTSLSGAYAGFDQSLRVGGRLTGALTGTNVNIIWRETFAGGTAVGTLSGARVTGTWAGYRDGGTWTSSESCPGM